MSALKRLGFKFLAGTIGLAVFGVAIYANHMYREGSDARLIVVAPLTSPLVATLDGTPIALGAGEVTRLTVAHGAHELVVSVPAPLNRRFVVDSGRNPRVVPVLAEQCYVELDVTSSHYGEGARPLPRPARVVRHDDVWISLDGLAFTEAELPDATEITTTRSGRVTGVGLVQLWRPVPCELDGRPDQVLRALGYAP